MGIIENNKAKKLIFSLIWCFFLIRITKIISFNFQNIFSSLLDIISVCIFFVLLIYVILNIFIKKKISKITFLIIYPIIGVIAYYINGFPNDYQESILINYFITLTSVILYFSLIQSDKTFDYKFNENLLKILLAFCIIFCFFNVIPATLAKIYTYESLRLSSATTIELFGSEITFHQNINGQSKFLLLIFILCIFFFKKFLFSKKIISHFFFIFSLLFITVIFLAQSRLNILASIVFSFFFLFMIKNLSLGKKVIYFLLILAVPISIFNIYTDQQNRFSKRISVEKKNSFQKDIIENFKIYNDEYNNELAEYLNIYINKDLKKEIKISDKEIKISDKEIINTLISIFKDSELLFEYKIIHNETSSFHEEFLVIYHIAKILEENFSKKKSTTTSLTDYSFDKITFVIKNKSDTSRKFIIRSCTENIRLMGLIDRLLTGRMCGWQILWNSISVKELILGKGFFADQVFLKPLEKVSSNSFINIFYNAGIISLTIFSIFLIIFFTKFFKIKNINDNNLYFALSHYLILYFLFRSIFEDTLAFVGVDLLIFSLCCSLISQKYNEKN